MYTIDCTEQRFLFSSSSSFQNNYSGDVTYPDTTVVPWIIPRPSLVKNEIEEITVDNLLKHSTVYPSNLFLALPTSPADKNKSFSSSTSSSSNASSKVSKKKKKNSTKFQMKSYPGLH